MADEATKKSDEPPPKPAGRGKGKLLVMLVIGVVLLAGGGAGGWILLHKRTGGETDAAPPGIEEELKADATGHGGQASADADAAAAGEALLYKFQDEFIVNLLDPRGRQYLQTNLQLKATSPQALKQLEQNDAPLRDAIIMLLSSKRREDLETAAGKERVKRELLARVEGIVDAKAVSDVYFTKWLLINQ